MQRQSSDGTTIPLARREFHFLNPEEKVIPIYKYIICGENYTSTQRYSHGGAKCTFDVKTMSLTYYKHSLFERTNHGVIDAFHLVWRKFRRPIQDNKVMTV
jgi:hypothetical protein